MRWTIYHNRFDVSVTRHTPTTKEGRNEIRQLLRDAGKGRLAGRDE